MGSTKYLTDHPGEPAGSQRYPDWQPAAGSPKNADPSAYADKNVADTVTWANDDNTVATIKEILTRLGLDTKAEFKDILKIK